MLRNSAYVGSKLILKLFEVFEIMLSTKLFARYKTFAAQNGEFERFGGFCVDSYYTFYKNFKRSHWVESSFSTAPVPSRFSPRNLNRPASSPWHSIGDPFKIQVLTAFFSRNAAFEAT